MEDDISEIRRAGLEARERSLSEPILAPRKPLSDLPPAIFDGDLAVKLEGATRLSIDRAVEILQMPAAPGDEGFQSILSAQTKVIGATLSTQARVDEAKLRSKQEGSIIGEILAKCEAIQRARREREILDSNTAIVDLPSVRLDS